MPWGYLITAATTAIQTISIASTINSKINGTPKMFLLSHFEATLYLIKQ